MATYLDLFTLQKDSDLQDRIAVACIKKAQELIEGDPLTNNAKAWVNETLKNPAAKAKEILSYVLAANSSSTTTAILGASDTTIQSNVSRAVDALIA